jgi:hypothetical protein
MITIKDDSKKCNPAIGTLKYGTLVTGVPSHPKLYYIKVNKQEHGRGFSLHLTPNHSVLLNIQSGTLRIVPGDTPVIVLDGLLIVNETQTISAAYKDDLLKTY